MLNDAGFENITIEEEYNDEVEEGYVISQNPESKTNFKYNVTQAITLTVSKGQKIVTLPKRIKGKKIDDVKNELDELELKYEIIQENSETVEAGIVIESDPEGGEEITAATTIQLTVSSGSAFKDVPVPSVLNKTEAEATNMLKALNLVVSVEYEENASKSDGVVTAQNVNANKVIKEGETVTITVNKQPKRAKVTINVNLKSLTGYTEPKPETVPGVDEYGNAIQTTTTPEIEKATVTIEVGDDTILNSSYPMTKTDISQEWTSSGVKNVKVKINGVTRYTNTVDFSKGDQVLPVS